ncbi:MAG: transglutaminase family protein [Acidimicrobiales bacterium]|nr:transglutaminase family protein [Acidimicrobiales bacterium]
MDPVARFSELVQGPEAALPLDEAALLVASHLRPGLDVPAQLARIDDLAGACWAPTLDALVRHLFVEQGFHGNRADYYDPRNSFLDEILDRRTGIPLSLSLLTMEVGRRIGVPLAGVGMPGHFLLRTWDPEVFVDAFDGGRQLTRRQCRARFHDVLGPDAEFDEAFLEPIGRRAILVRLLANLKSIYLRAGDRRSLAWVLGLAVRMPGAAPADRQLLARVLAALGRFDEAAEQLEVLVVDVASAADAGRQGLRPDELLGEASRLRARLN